jgi:iron(III) transport system permease protein
VTRWRWAVAVVLLALIAVPLAMPFIAFARVPSAWTAFTDVDRLLVLARNTLLMVGGTLALATPLGVVGAVLLYRTDLPLRRPLRFILILTLFIPLPLLASGWQSALGSGGWLPAPIWTTPPRSDPDVSSTGIAWKPWATGLPAAVWIHATAGLPWIILLVGQGLRWVERELEEDALTVLSPWRVLLGVTLPRCRAALFAAMIWVALQTATEITVTDMLQIRTFAEEVYNQLTRPDQNTSVPLIQIAVARAVAVSLPGTLLVGLAVAWAARRWEHQLPTFDRLTQLPLQFTLGRARWPLALLTLIAVGVLVGIPVGSLIWRVGLTANTPDPLHAAMEDFTPGRHWSAATAEAQLRTVVHVRGGLVTTSLWQAAVAGAGCALLAWMTCWLAAGSRRFRALALVLLVAAWSMPGPVIGIGLIETIKVVLSVTHSSMLDQALYRGVSPIPLWWAFLVRFFPAAVAVCWPVMRLLPEELVQSARVDGATPFYELRRVIWPLTSGVFVLAGLAVAVLSLGELSASKLVEPAGQMTFAHEVFTQMHYGVTNDVPALCLILLGAVFAGGTALAILGRLLRRPSVE